MTAAVKRFAHKTRSARSDYQERQGGRRIASPGSADLLSTIIATLLPHGGPHRSLSNAASIGSRSDNQG